MKLKQLYVFACYILMGFGLTLLSPEAWTDGQIVGACIVLLSLLGVDMISFNQGLNRGCEIANEVMHDLCKSKKIKVVSYD